jgi:hypothetical protein
MRSKRGVTWPYLVKLVIGSAVMLVAAFFIYAAYKAITSPSGLPWS